MRGAVLHKMGLNYVKERLMRRHYGVSHNRPFEYGKDPISLKGTNAAGTVICRTVMKWYANKVYFFAPFCSLLGPEDCNRTRYQIPFLQIIHRARISRFRTDKSYH